MRGNNRLKLGLFGANCSSGNAVTTIENGWSGSREDCLRLAQTADDAGIEFMLPIGRWKGYGGETGYQGATLETIRWATGLLAKTRRLTVFSTVYAPLFHPVVAAKQMATASHIGKGRFGLNVVCGWNEDEFEMFGRHQRDHEARYHYAQEWLGVVNEIWRNPDTFDFDGEFFQLKDVRARPKFHGKRRPIVMNASQSPTGQAFAARNCDALFLATGADTFDKTAAQIVRVQGEASAHGRSIDVYTIGALTCRANAKEAHEYYDYCLFERADWSAIDHILALRRISSATMALGEYDELRRRTASGLGGLKLVGDPDDIACELARLSEAGVAGIALTMIDYAMELTFFCEAVLPRLERLGLRTGATAP
jgi:alkanesulfonate monooxygenase SsuD/methylene tetrahydromethanopterin reductase-like flavin-dependent oxidoreductase (luciferase family)